MLPKIVGAADAWLERRYVARGPVLPGTGSGGGRRALGRRIMRRRETGTRLAQAMLMRFPGACRRDVRPKDSRS